MQRRWWIALLLAAQCGQSREITTADHNVGHQEGACDASDVQWVWKGALTSHAITFKFGLVHDHTCKDTDFVLHAFPALLPSEKPHSSVTICHGIPSVRFIKECRFTDLPHANRTYQYEMVLLHTQQNNQLIRKGTFQTPPEEGKAFNFRLAFSSCADEQSDPAVFEAIQATNPLLFLHMGDLHYGNLEVNDPLRFRHAYASMFASPAGQEMLGMDLPFAYMWDDHDYGPDNSDKTAPGRNASLQVYHEIVPHYALVQENALTGPIYQAFTIGRVRFLLTDLRSERTPNLSPDTPSKTVLGVAQKQWFKQEILASVNDPSIRLILWVSTMPWHDDERKWGYFTHEQRELVAFFQANGLHNKDSKTQLIILSGDAHMLAVDDGTYSPGNVVTLHAAALGKPGSVKGGPYSHGVIAGPGQFGLLDVKDDGDRVCLHYQGIKMQDTMITYDTCAPETTPSNGTYVPPAQYMRKFHRQWKKTKRFLWKYAVLICSSGVLMMALILYAHRPFTRRPQGRSTDKKQR